MIGSIIGDICGSSYEYREFDINEIDLLNDDSKFTDDTILTVAIADAILNQKDFAKTIKSYALEYPDAGYGSKFKEWLNSNDLQGYNSYGNGGAMRVSSIPFLFSKEKKVLDVAYESAEATHNHEEGIKGALAIVLAINLLKKGASKEELKYDISNIYGYDLDNYIISEKFTCTAEDTVPNAIIAFLKGNSFEETLINAIQLKGDTDTVACMAGGMAEVYYGLDSIPHKYIEKMKQLLPQKYLDIIKEVYYENNLIIKRV